MKWILGLFAVFCCYQFYKRWKKASEDTAEVIDRLRKTEIADNLGCEVDSASLVFLSQHPFMTAKASWLIRRVAAV